MKQKLRLLVILVISIFLITSCSNTHINSVKEQKPQQVSGAPKSGGTVVVAISPIKFSPFQATTDEEKAAVSLVYEGLVKIGGDGTVLPALAKSWEISDDAKKFTFNLRDDVKWHNGDSFTSDDVKATFDKIFEIKKKSKKGDVPEFSEFNNVRSFKSIDKNTFEVTLSTSDSSFVYDMAIGIVPASWLNNVDESELPQNPYGTGKFKIKNISNEEIVLERNDNYYDKKTYIDGLVLKIFYDSDIMKDAFKQNKVDIIPIEDEDWSLMQGIEDVQLLQYPSRYFEFMALNLRNPIFKDVNVRKGLLLGIDRSRILQDAILGKGIIIDSPILPFSWAYNKRIQHMDYNQSKARQMLDSAGWTDTDGDGIRDKKIGGKKRKLEFELLVNSSNGARYKAALNIQKNLKDIGVLVNLVDLPWKELEDKVFAKKYDAALMGWKLATNPDVRFMFSSGEIARGYNFVSYSNKELDEILLKTQSETNVLKMLSLISDAQKIISDEVPYIFLYSPNNLLALNKKINGFNPDPISIFNNVSEWWVE